MEEEGTDPFAGLKAGTILLSGVVGSRAYGLARATSDYDRLAVWAAPTLDLVGLDTIDPTWKGQDDSVAHEAGKYLRLALACNPTVSELLWLDEHEKVSELGRELVGMRSGLLSKERVKDAYLGYAQSQLSKLEKRGETFSSDTAKRTRKHAMHMARLVRQGYELYTSGHLNVRVADPGWYEQFAREEIPVWKEWFAHETRRFAQATSALPEKANLELARTWLRTVRAESI